MSNITRFVFVRYDGDLAVVATVAALALLTAIGGCARDAVVPTSAPPRVPGHVVRAVSAPPVPVTSLLDSFSIGDYTVLPRGGYAGGMWYARSPEKDLYAGKINNHPTGLVVPVGLPIRVLAEGRLISRSTAAFQTDYCARSGGWDPNCGVGAFEYSVHGLAPWYEAGTGLSLTWFPNAGYYDRFFGVLPAAEFVSGWVPSSGALTHRELYIRRLGCCYSIPSGSAAWETYEGVWRLGVVPFDGGQAELGVPAVLRLSGPRTDGPMAAPADFTVSAANGDLIDATRWWYVRPAHNVFDGERVDSVPTGTPYPPFLPRYPDAQRSLFTEIGACAGQTTCRYQAMEAGVVLVQATLLDRLVQRIPWVFAARNTGRSGAHVKITADSTTLAYGDTTVFRVTAPGATRWWVTEYSFMPVGAVATSAVQAVRGPAALRKASLAAMSPEGVRVVRGRTTARFRDAALACSEATIELCYDFPSQTGYEIVTALVDGEVQRDSVLVTVVPLIVIESAGGPNEQGSFLTAVINRERPENVIKLKARVAPANLASNVEWEIAPLDSLVGTVVPDSAPRGASTSFIVPVGVNRSPNGIHWKFRTPTDSFIDRGRWPSTHPGTAVEKQAQLARKALGFRVTAIVTADGRSVRSLPRTIQQDEKDVMREEYVDFGWSLDSIPPRDSLGKLGPADRNLTGDYQYWMTGSRLDQKMPVMIALSDDAYEFSPVIMSGYRNPVHHFVHAKATARRSQHLTGNATDWRILEASSRPTGMTADTWFTKLFYLTRDSTVNGCWEPSKAIKDGSGGTLDHAHSDWRVMTLRSCPASWRRRD